jgi:Fic family protein
MLEYKLTETGKIKALLVRLEALRILFEGVNVLPQVEENFRRESLLKSALFSARVEGNNLSLDKVRWLSERERKAEVKKREIFNLLRAYRYVYGSRTPKKITIGLLKKIHRLVMNGLSEGVGEFRKEPWAVFNQAGVAVYLAPTPRRVEGLMKDWVIWTKKTELPVPIKAAVGQFLLEKIHPFADGNGRVGRLVSSYVVVQGGYGFRRLVSIEEGIDQNREEYYQVLEPSRDVTGFVEFFLKVFVLQTEAVLARLRGKGEKSPEDFLLPRRREILAIIGEHPDCSFDFLRRRFLAVKPKTLHYDVQQLQKEGLIVKLGKTRGAVYRRDAAGKG